MISEIVTGGKYAIVVQIGKNQKQNKFIPFFNELKREMYIEYCEVRELYNSICRAFERERKVVKKLNVSESIAKEIERRFF